MSNLLGLVLIPARFGSTRFPGKPLAKILNKSMIQMVYENMTNGQLDGIDLEVAIVTDDDRIEEHVKSFSGKVVRVDDDVCSGTLRINLAYQRFFKERNFDFIVNVQGDEPLLNSIEIEKLLKFQKESEFPLVTIVKKEESIESFNDPNKVKTIFSKESGKCHYFSRSPIPYSRDELVREWFLHIGVYSYTPEALEKICSENISYYENLEKLEQLRALERGIQIGAIETERKLMGVDTPEDIKRVELFLGEKNG